MRQIFNSLTVEAPLPHIKNVVVGKATSRVILAFQDRTVDPFINSVLNRSSPHKVVETVILPITVQVTTL